MKPVAFNYLRPGTVDVALQFLRDNPESKILAGGQSLIPLMNFRLSRPTTLIDINGLGELSEVRRTDNGIAIGALVRHQELHENALIRDAIPALSKAAGEVGHWAIRNRGTLGGSLTHADPAAELPAAMVALDAQFVLQNADGERKVPAREFYLGFLMTDIQPDELLVSVEIPVDSGTQVGFAEFARRPGDFALAGAFVQVGASGGSVTWFGISGGPEHREVSSFASDSASRSAQFAGLLEDVDAGDEGEYRKQLAVEMAEKAYQQATGGQAK